MQHLPVIWGSWDCPCVTAENRLEPVYPTIRYKLANALKSWHPSDQSAHMILEPWVDVFPPGVMETFVSRTILPQLSYCLQLMVINPNNQDIREYMCCSMGWSCDQQVTACLHPPRALQVGHSMEGHGLTSSVCKHAGQGFLSQVATGVVSRHL